MILGEFDFPQCIPVVITFKSPRRTQRAKRKKLYFAKK
jgi:hypothetical protein